MHLYLGLYVQRSTPGLTYYVNVYIPFLDIYPRSSGINGGSVAGAVIATLVVVAIVSLVLLVYIYYKIRRRKQMERMQLDILAL